MVEALSYGLFQTGLGIYIVTLFGASLIGWLHLAHLNQSPAWLRPSVLALIALVVVPSGIQIFIWPELLGYLQRDAVAITTHHEWWRPLTAASVQGGAFGGAVFNLICLLLLAPISAKLFGFRATAIVFVAGILCGELAGLWVLPIGAGNSVGNFGIASLIIFMALLRGTTIQRFCAAIISIVGLSSLSFLDIHGFALASGFIVSGLLAYTKIVTWPRQTTADHMKSHHSKHRA